MFSLAGSEDEIKHKEQEYLTMPENLLKRKRKLMDLPRQTKRLPQIRREGRSGNRMTKKTYPTRKGKHKNLQARKGKHKNLLARKGKYKNLLAQYL